MNHVPPWGEHRSCLVTVLVLSLASFGCRTASLPDMQLQEDRIDSLATELDDRDLHITAFCGAGIGSFTMIFSEPVMSDHLVLTLMYDDGVPYRECENLEISVSYGGSEMEYLHPPGGVSLEEGRHVQRTGLRLEAITVFWIDYYRS